MAKMKRCRACGYEPVARFASACPNCGVSNPTRGPVGTVLGIVVLLLVLAVFIVMAIAVVDGPSL